MANDNFEFRGLNSVDYGLHIVKQPAIPRPKERVAETEIYGRSGKLLTYEGESVYDDVVISVDVLMDDDAQLSAAFGFLSGYGELRLPCRPGGHYRARLSNQFDFDVVMRGKHKRTGQLQFICDPFWYVDDVEDVTISESGAIVTNPYSVASDPLITITGTGDTTLLIGTQSVILTGIDESVTLDCELMEAYKGTASQNGIMSGDFPRLEPGSNTISYTGSAVTQITIAPRYRTL